MQENACGGENPKNPLTALPQSDVDKTLAELKTKMAAIEKKEEHKAAVVSKLFARLETPFTKQVTLLTNKFKTPQIPSYSGIGDPIEHLENY